MRAITSSPALSKLSSPGRSLSPQASLRGLHQTSAPELLFDPQTRRRGFTGRWCSLRASILERLADSSRCFDCFCARLRFLISLWFGPSGLLC
nr:hypothetical protein CFP56_48943 [Quercus suber]